MASVAKSWMSVARVVVALGLFLEALVLTMLATEAASLPVSGPLVAVAGVSVWLAWGLLRNRPATTPRPVVAVVWLLVPLIAFGALLAWIWFALVVTS